MFFFCFFLKFLLDKCPFLWSHWLLLFWTSCVLPHGFQSQSGSLTCTLSCLHAVILKVTNGVTPAFSTNRSVHCIKCTRHGWPGSSHMHRDLNHQCSGELLSGAWLSQTHYRLSYSAGHVRACLHNSIPSPSSFIIVTMVMGRLTGKMGSTPILPVRRPVKKIEGATQRWRYV